VIEEAQPAQGGSLTFPIPPQSSGEMNPLKIGNVELYNLYTLIYEQPVRIGTDGKAQPELAETWSVDATGTVWTFKLRQGVQWQGGHGEFTSDDVIYTIGLIRSYAAEDSTFARYNSRIASCDAPDAYTVTVTLTEPSCLGVYFMTFPVVCKAYCSAGNIDNLNPLGTGPYEVAEYDADKQMVLSINASWWKRAPYIETLTAICYENSDDELAVFDQNMLDFMTTSELTVDTYNNTRHSYMDYLTQYYDCLVPNTASALFGDINIRQAVGYAIDRRDIISKALLGHAVATDYPVSPDSYLSGASSNIYEYNQENARKLLELSGWKDRDADGIFEKVEGTDIIDLTFELLIPINNENTYRHDVAENIKAQLAKCGMDVTIAEVAPTDYVQRLQSGSFELALCSFYLDDYPDVSFLIGTDGAQNYGAFSDETMDGLLASCKSALDEKSMAAAFIAMEQRFIETVPQIGLYYKTNALLYDVAITVSGDVRDLNIYTTLPGWYLYTKNAAGEIIGSKGTASAEAAASPASTAGTGE
jgi:ABC-type dipeptide transport system, periplasmic component